MDLDHWDLGQRRGCYGFWLCVSREDHERKKEEREREREREKKIFFVIKKKVL
jgi:hypothetical protein